MKTRRLGTLEVSEIGAGCMSISAKVYGPHTSEALVGEATRSVDHLHENLGAMDVPLTLADLREIETAVSGITVHGGRMNQEQMRVVDQAA